MEASGTRLVEPRVGEFSVEMPPVSEIQNFYSLDKVAFPSERPYIWSNTLISLDGVVSVGQGTTGVRILSLRNMPNAKARTDFKLLAAGWAYCDAILFSSQTLRAESEQKLLIPLPDLIKFRKESLNKENEQPDVIVVTASGWLDLKHPIWTTNRRKLVATSTTGIRSIYMSISNEIQNLKGEDDSSTLDKVSQYLSETYQITLKSFDDQNQPSNVHLVNMATFLKKEWKVNTIDISAGPTLISMMMKSKLVDECRFTTSGIVVGKKPTGGEGIEEPDERPESYPASVNDYPAHKWPLLEFAGIRLYGPYHVYHRGVWQYRH